MLFWNYRAEAPIFGLLPRLLSGRLASLAASICSGVLTSGSESFTCFFARETWRLCRFSNLLSILLHYTRTTVVPSMSWS
jgi:hypothetical protein